MQCLSELFFRQALHLNNNLITKEPAFAGSLLANLYIKIRICDADQLNQQYFRFCCHRYQLSTNRQKPWQ